MTPGVNEGGEAGQILRAAGSRRARRSLLREVDVRLPGVGRDEAEVDLARHEPVAGVDRADHVARRRKTDPERAVRLLDQVPFPFADRDPNLRDAGIALGGRAYVRAVAPEDP